MSDNITLPREVVEEAAESLEWADSQVGGDDCYEDAAKALRAALAAPSEDIETLRRENERLRGLLTDASKAVWMNYDGELLDRIEAALKEVPR